MEVDGRESEGLIKVPSSWIISNTHDPDILKVVRADEIRDKIRNGEEVIYDHVIIEDDLDISKLDFKMKKTIDRTKFEREALFLKDTISIISSVIKITNSKINDNINMSNIFFAKGVDFAGSEFGKDATFDGSCFNEDVNFIESAFLKGANFRGSRYLGNAHFMRSNFYGDAKFHGSQFVARADFEGSEFGKSVFFDYSLFGITTRFYQSHVIGYASFFSSQFKGNSTFSNSTFDWSVDFTSAIFFDDFYFTESMVGGDAYFIGSHFVKYIDLWGSQIKGDALSFKYAKFDVPKYQEDACRKAKKVLEDRGNREEADYHFYREMEAKRKQNGVCFWHLDYEYLRFYNDSGITGIPHSDEDLSLKNMLIIISRYLRYDIFEYAVFEKIFGYGVHPYKIPFWWAGTAFVFGVFYNISHGIDNASCLPQCITYSLFIAFTKGGIGNCQPKPGFEWVVGLETFIGLIMFGAFLASITRKYMR